MRPRGGGGGILCRRPTQEFFPLAQHVHVQLWKNYNIYFTMIMDRHENQFENN